MQIKRRDEKVNEHLTHWEDALMRKALLATHNPHSSHFISGACVFLVEISLQIHVMQLCVLPEEAFSLLWAGMKHIIISHGRTPTAPRLSSTRVCLRIVCLGDGNDLLFHLFRIIPPPASDSRCRGVRGEGPPLQGYILRNAARICSQVGEGTHVCARTHAHTHTHTHTHTHIHWDILLLLSSLKHTPVGGSLKLCT